MAEVLECVVFGARAGVDRAEFVAAAAGVEEFLAGCAGFVSRELFEAGDGRWIDLVRWASMDAAHQALAAAETSEVAGRFFGLIDQASVQLLHGEAVLPVTRA